MLRCGFDLLELPRLFAGSCSDGLPGKVMQLLETIRVQAPEGRRLTVNPLQSFTVYRRGVNLVPGIHCEFKWISRLNVLLIGTIRCQCVSSSILDLLRPLRETGDLI